MQRFLGGLQVFGGLSLISAYAPGATTPALHAAHASSVLLALGALQMGVGVWWLLRVRDVRRMFVRRPGTVVAATVTASVAVMAFGGANADTLWVTSAQCWLIAAGCALPGLRALAATVAASAAVAVVWFAYETEQGGHRNDGNLLTAIVGLVFLVLAGLWMGRLTGAATRNLSRWHLVEVHEVGLVDRLRRRLERIDQAASSLAGKLPTGSGAAELADLRDRLRFGVGVSRESKRATVASLLDELASRSDDDEDLPRIRVRFEADTAGAELSAATADALDAVIRRQFANVVRHAPEATEIWVRAEIRRGHLAVTIEDDGAGLLPERAGVGTEWSARQLARVGGAARYYAGDAGVGFEIEVPLLVGSSLSAVPELSITQGLSRFGIGLLTTVRLAGYIGDSITTYAYADEIGARWLVMPLGALLIEFVMSDRGWPGRRVAFDVRLVLGSLVSIAMTAALVLPADGPDFLLPATTSIIVISTVLYARRVAWWAGLVALRAVVLLPLVERAGVAASLQLVLFYPLGLTVIVLMLVRFTRSAGGLEQRTADAVGRAALAGASVRGLALRHDAVDATKRLVGDPDIEAAADELATALQDLADLVSGAFDPVDVIATGLEAATELPVDVGRPRSMGDAVQEAALVAAIDRVTLIELAGLIADERGTCAPPGVFGRRRLRGLILERTAVPGGREFRLQVRAVPSLRPPDPHAAARLADIAGAIGVSVDSSPDSLTLTFVPT